MYTGVTFVIAVRTLCSPTTTPSDLSNPVRVRRPYDGPTCKYSGINIVQLCMEFTVVSVMSVMRLIMITF